MSTEITDSTGQEVFRDGAYWLAADGKVYREEVIIGRLDEAGKVVYGEGMQRYSNRVGRLLNSRLGAPATEPKPDEPAKEEGETVPELSLTQIMCDYPDGAPAYDWRGDLTPDFVEWYFTHYPERAKRRYAERGLRPVVQDVLAKLQLSIY